MITCELCRIRSGRLSIMREIFKFGSTGIVIGRTGYYYCEICDR